MMMHNTRRKTFHLTALLASSVVAWSMGPGCTGDPPGSGGGGGETTGPTQDDATEVALSEEVGTFIIDGSEGAVQNAGTTTIEVPDGPITEGTLSIDPNDVTFTATQPAKQSAAARTVGTFTTRVAIGPATDNCQDAVYYGPFTISFDENGDATQVSPASVPLESSTTVLLQQRIEVLVCIEVVAPGLSARIDIRGLELQLKTEQVSGPTGGACNASCGFDDNAPDGLRAAAICSITYPDAPVVQNGDIVDFEFDHKALSVTVNGVEASGDGKFWSWTVQGLSTGSGTLDVQWTNRAGATPATGCHTDTVTVR